MWLSLSSLLNHWPGLRSPALKPLRSNVSRSSDTRSNGNRPMQVDLIFIQIWFRSTYTSELNSQECNCIIGKHSYLVLKQYCALFICSLFILRSFHSALFSHALFSHALFWEHTDSVSFLCRFYIVYETLACRDYITTEFWLHALKSAFFLK